MRPAECPRERDVLEALQTSAWPDCCPAELRAHVGACAACGDLVAIVLPLIDEHRTAVGHAPVPSSAIVWWRAQTRARREATAVAMRPITIVQGLALACALGVVAGGASLVSPAFRASTVWVANTVAAIVSTEAPTGWTTASLLATPLGMAMALAFALIAVVMPVAFYLAGGED
jgi:hypothetical protein